MDRHRVARRAPVPLRRLIVLWFAESSLDRGWRSEILGLHLEALLGALAPGSLVLLFIGFDGSAWLAGLEHQYPSHSFTDRRYRQRRQTSSQPPLLGAGRALGAPWPLSRLRLLRLLRGGVDDPKSPQQTSTGLSLRPVVQGLPDSLPRLPWKSGVMAMIFGDSILPKPLVVQPCAPSKDTSTIDGDPILASSSRARPAPSTLYERSFCFQGGCSSARGG